MFHVGFGANDAPANPIFSPIFHVGFGANDALSNPIFSPIFHIPASPNPTIPSPPRKHYGIKRTIHDVNANDALPQMIVPPAHNDINSPLIAAPNPNMDVSPQIDGPGTKRQRINIITPKNTNFE